MYVSVSVCVQNVTECASTNSFVLYPEMAADQPRNRVRIEFYIFYAITNVCLYTIWRVCVCVFVVVAAASFSSCEQSMRFLRISNGVYVTNGRLS